MYLPGVKGGYSFTTLITKTNIQTYIQAQVDLLVIVQDTKGHDDVRVPIEAVRSHPKCLLCLTVVQLLFCLSLFN